MNIVFIIGNGFDLNLGLKTSYHDFYNYYNSINSSNSRVERLKKDISSGFENWSDLELALGKYTTHIDKTTAFDEVFEDIGNSLVTYLKDEEKKANINYEKTDKNKFFHDLVYPEEVLTEFEKEELKEFKNIWRHTSRHINIMTFNYTKSLENLLGKYDTQLSLVGNTVLHNIHHIHGYLDDRMVIGVNDISQITNKRFHNNLDIIEALVKQQCNKVAGHMIDKQCKDLINSSNLICVFGSSLGETDKLWWELIARKLLQDRFKLIIFEWIINCPPSLREYKKERIRREKKDNFLNKTTLSEKEKEIAKKNIFVGINTNLFKNIYAN